MNTKTKMTPTLSRFANLLVLTLALAAGPAGAQVPEITPSQERMLSLVRGGSTRIPVEEGVKGVVVGNERVLDARPDEKAQAVVVVGLVPGSSELRIERLQGAELVYRVLVRSDIQAVFEEVRQLLGHIEGLEVKQLGDRVLLEGGVLTLADAEKVKKIANAYSGIVLNLSEFDLRHVHEVVEQETSKDLRALGVDTVSVRIEGNRLILQGTAISQAELDQVVRLAQFRVPQVVNLVRIEDAMIETDVRFVQVSADTGSSYGNNVLQSLGVDGKTGLGGGSSGRPSLAYGVSASAALKVNALIGSGAASNLVQTHLSTKSGEEGRFQSGAEDNLLVSGNVGGDLKTVSYGIIIRVRPILRTRDTIENKVYVEISVPTQKTREGLVVDKFASEATLVCKKGESMVLSGLLQSFGSRTGSRTPLIGYIPLVDMFFSEREKKGSRKELVAVITQNPILPTPSDAEPFSRAGARLSESIVVR